MAQDAVTLHREQSNFFLFFFNTIIATPSAYTLEADMRAVTILSLYF